MSFGPTLTLTDLNDYLAPSQACIRPAKLEEEVEQTDGAKTQIHIDASGGYYELALPSTLPSTLPSSSTAPATLGSSAPGVVEEKKKLKKAEISLNDCLACSGCITTSQELLLQTHSLTPLLSLLPPNPPSKTPYLSLSPQSLASLAASLSTPLPLPILLSRLRAFLPSIGIPHVSDVTFARHLSLSETVREFGERRRGEGGGLPMLASACPGWVCYAEKAHGEVLEKVGKVRSAMGVQGALVKSWWAKKNGIDPSNIYHVSVQPCYDRKLESSRTQFIDPATSLPETDLVLTTGEFHTFLSDHNFDPLALSPGESIPLPSEASSSPLIEGLPSMLSHPGSSSDSYLHSLLFSLIARYPPDSLILTTTPIRNSSDYIEYTLSVSPSYTPPPPSYSSSSSSSTIPLPSYLPLPPPNTQIFRSSKCYGFKNLQNVVRSTKKVIQSSSSSLPSSTTGAASRRPIPKTYDYVEVMACPSGCVNGGGQLKPTSSSSTASSSQQPLSTINSSLPTEFQLDTPKPSAPVDKEGFPRPWEAVDSSISSLPSPADPSTPGIDAEMRWSTKEWVAKVEAIYWGDVSSPHEVRPGAMAKSTLAASVPKRHLDLQEADRWEDIVRDEMGGGREWLRTGYEAIKPDEEGDLLGSGVVW